MSAPPPKSTGQNSKENGDLGVASPAPEIAAESTDARSRELGRWRLLKPIARGGMGEVYLATAAGGIEGAERPAVVKLIRREHAQDKSFLARFFDEARIQAQLQHPGVAQVLEATTDPSGKPYVALEYVEGRNLGEIRERAAHLGVSLSWADAIAIAVSLCEALVHVHERKDARGRDLAIVHRDLSPHNVMVGYGGDVKLIDFGTARGENRHCQTVSGIVFAKPGYVAPEVANNTPGGAPADIYALGVILWELIMGRRFLTGDAQQHLAEVAAGRATPPAVSLTNNVPLELDTLIARLCAPRVEDRHASTREAMTDLVRVLKRAPSLADGERSVRGRIAHLMARLYPAEPARTRAEFSRLVAEFRELEKPKPMIPQSPTPSDSQAPLLPGTRYRLDRQLSKNTMSVVYEALHQDLGRRVALKVLPREHCNNPEFEKRFREEARSLARLKHENIVQLHDFGVTEDGRPYCAMEFLDGKPLKAAELELMEWSTAVSIAVDVCAALEAAHAEDIVHRDITPGNVFLSDNGEVKVIDFGIAQTKIENDEQHSDSLRVTGTPAYMAPEQLGKRSVDGRADIYALGVVLYELLTGELPHQGAGTVQLFEAKQKVIPRAPSQLRPGRGIPAALDRVVNKALSADPSQRFPTAHEFGEALARTLTSQRRTRRRLQALAAVAGFSVALAGLGKGYDSLTAAAGAASAPIERSKALSEVAIAVGQPATAPSSEVGSPVHAAVLPPQQSEAGEAPPALATFGAAEQQPDVPDATPATERRNVANEPAPQQTAIAQQEGGEAQSLDNALALATAAVHVDPDLEQTLMELEHLARKGPTKLQRALTRCRKLGKQYPENSAVLRTWSRVAARAQWWGESLRVAIRWAAQDESAEAQLHLARTQRLVGQKYGAIQTLKRFLAERPQHEQALAMLEKYRRS